MARALRAVFETASGAVTAALEIQVALAETAGTTADDRRLRFRIGVHLGEVTERQGPDSATQVKGLAVDVAARVQALPDNVLLHWVGTQRQSQDPHVCDGCDQ